MGPCRETPFDNIESAHEYVQLLCEAVDESLQHTAADLEAADAGRQRDALRLVVYKLTQLRASLTTSSRVLNDLRTLRRLLLHERTPPLAAHERPSGADGRRDGTLRRNG
jgi:hypothetical protein